MKFTPAKLFHAVVISGAALTGCATMASKPIAHNNSSTATPNAADVNTAPANAPPAETASPPKCPPGSERPYPPCYWIL
jgi:hypothetical protein